MTRLKSCTSAEIQQAACPTALCRVLWLLGANLLMAVEEADVTTAFKYEEAAAKGRGIIWFYV